MTRERLAELKRILANERCLVEHQARELIEAIEFYHRTTVPILSPKEQASVAKALIEKAVSASRCEECGVLSAAGVKAKHMKHCSMPNRLRTAEQRLEAIKERE